MTIDYILNGQGYGDVANGLMDYGMDPQLMRPFFDSKGRDCVLVNTGETDEEGNPIYAKELTANAEAMGLLVNGPTTLRKDDWIRFDRAVIMAARARLRAWADLSARNSYGGFNGMAKTILEHETVSDPGEAIMDMDGDTPGRNFEPKFQLEGLPLPITHSDFHIAKRRLLVSRQGGTPLDTMKASVAGRRVAETIEQTLIGTATAFAYGPQSGTYGTAPKVYGYINHPDRITKTDLNTPDGTNGEDVLTDVLEMIQAANDANFFGPFMLYHSTPYSVYLDNLFSTTEPSAGTLRNRIREIDEIQDVRRLDYLTSGYQLILVQMTEDVARAVNGMDITTVQWDSHGGNRVNFKVMTIQVPQLRSDYNGNMGLVHGTTS